MIRHILFVVTPFLCADGGHKVPVCAHAYMSAERVWEADQRCARPHNRAIPADWIHPQSPDGTFIGCRSLARHLTVTFRSLCTAKVAACVEKLDQI